MSDTAAVIRKKRRPFYTDLSFQVFVGMVLGVLVGWLRPHVGAALEPLGEAFIRMITMVIGPIVFCTVVHGIAVVRDLKKVGRIALKAIVYFELATTLALVIAMVVTNLLAPGSGMHIDPSKLDASAVKSIAGHAHHVETTAQFLLEIIPRTVFDAFTRGDILEILFFSVLFAGGLASLGDRAQPVLDVIDATQRALFWIIGIAMKFAPIAAFGSIAYTVGKFGLHSLLSLGKLIGVFYFICVLFIVLVLLPVAMWARFSLIKMMRYIGEELLLVIGTSSSETVFPQLTRKLTQLGCDESVVGIVLPTAYSFNHDGTCLYFAAASIFLAQATNTPLDWTHQLGLLAVLLLTSKGAAGISGAALPVLAITLAATNTIPVASIALILGVHRVLSAAFVFTNITGNAVATIVVAAWENALDRTRLRAELDAGYVPEPLPDLIAEPVPVRLLSTT
jgi:aerobic C4-dicarboxylate transport protein